MPVRHYIHLEDNDGAWEDISRRVVAGAGKVSFPVGDQGHPVLSPPSSLRVDNTDGWWLTAPVTAGGRWQGTWEGRRLRIQRAAAGGAAVTIGIFRIAAERGYEDLGDGFGELRMESLAAALSRADAADVRQGTGWFTDAPILTAIDKLRKPEDTSTITWPTAQIAYEEAHRLISSIGRPGDFRDGAFYELPADERAVDCTWNEAKAVFAYVTLKGTVYEWDPATGEWTQLAVSWPTTGGDHYLRIWWKRESAGDGIYLGLVAANSYASAYYDPRFGCQKGCAFKVYRHDQAAYLFAKGGYYQLMPCVIRDACRDRTGWDYPYVLPDPNKVMIYGDEYPDFEHWEPDFYGIRFRREAIILPFDQYAYPLESRDPAKSPLIDQIDVAPITHHFEHEYSPLNACGHDGENDWTIEPVPAEYAGLEFRESELRYGAGYYVWVLRDADDGLFAWDNPNDYISPKTGLRHCLGQGPLVDLSFQHAGDAAWDGKFWMALPYWANSGWQIRVIFFDGTTAHEGNAALLGKHTLPTFVICDITRPGTGAANEGAILYGWIDYESNSTQEIGVGNNRSGSTYMARSGISVCPVASAPANAAPSFPAQSPFTVIKFAEREESGDTITRRYWESAPAHISGRWTPVALGFKRSNAYFQGFSFAGYACVVSCLDRMEPGPIETGAYERGGLGDDRAGVGTYRLLYVRIVVQEYSGQILAYCDDDSDGYGPGFDIQARYPLPPMGFSRVCRGLNGDEGSHNTAEDVYFYSPSDRMLYASKLDAGLLGKPVPLGVVPGADTWMGPGRLAVGNESGDLTKPLVAGLAHPAFPGSTSEQWPGGEYRAWAYAHVHGGRVPLLDCSDLKKDKAIGLLAGAMDAVYFIDRDGVGQVKPYPSSGTPTLTLKYGSCYSSAKRGYLPVVNDVQRSVNDIVPGEAKITTLATAKSRFSALPIFSGLGVKPVTLDLRCIASGMTGRPPMGASDNPDVLRGKLLWAWKLTSNRIQTKLVYAAAAGATYIFPESYEDLAVGDLVTLGPEDDAVPIASIAYGLFANLARPLVESYAVGDVLIADKAGSGYYSDSIRWDQDLERYVGPAHVVNAASAGDTHITVSDSAPFAEGNFLRFHPPGDDQVVGASPNAYRGIYRVARVIQPGEGINLASGLHMLEIVNLVAANGPGIEEDVDQHSPISVWLNVPPIGRAQRIGQTGIYFSLYGKDISKEDLARFVQGGGDWEDTTEAPEPPIAEGDTIRLVYPGMVINKNQQHRVDAVDQTSIAAYGRKKPTRTVANKFLDYPLALTDVWRTVRRGKDPRIWLELEGVEFADPVPQALLLALEPWDVVRVIDYRRLRDRDDYTADFLVTEIGYDITTGRVNLRLEELETSAPGERFAGDNVAPGKPGFRAVPLDGAVALSWTPPGDADFAGVEIRWSTTAAPRNSKEGTLLAKYSAGTYECEHTGRSNGTTYFYACFAEDDDGAFSAPEQASATPRAAVAVVTGFAAASNEDEQITLAWTDPAATSGFTGVLIRVATDDYPADETDGDEVAVVGPGVQTYVVTGLDNGRRYYFSAFTVDSAGVVSAAAEAAGTPDFDPERDCAASVSARWRAHDLIGTVADGDPIDALADASGSGHDLAKYSDATRPVLDAADADYNDLPVIVIDDTSGLAKTLKAAAFDAHSNDNGFAIIIVGEASTTGTGQNWIRRYGGAGSAYWYIRGQAVAFYEQAAGTNVAFFNNAYSVDVAHIIEAVWYPEHIAAKGDGEAFGWVDDAYVANDKADAPADIDTGGSREVEIGSASSTGYITRYAEIILLNAADVGAIERVRDKLRKKYQPAGMAPLTSDAPRAFSRGFGVEFDRPPYYEFDSAFAQDFLVQRKREFASAFDESFAVSEAIV